MTVAGEIEGDHALDRRELDLPRQRHEAVRAGGLAEVDAAAQFRDLETLGAGEALFADDLGERGLGKVVVAGIAAEQAGDARPEFVAGAAGIEFTVFGDGFERQRGTAVAETAVEEDGGTGLVGRVEPEVAGGVVGLAVAVEVGGDERSPQTGLREALGGGAVGEALAGVIVEVADGPPLRGEQQVGPAVGVEVAEDGGGDQAEFAVVGQRDLGESAAVVAQQGALGRERVTAGQHAGAEE